MTSLRFQKNTEYEIKYINSSGQQSQRKIRIISVYSSSNGTEYIRAWCYKRGEERTFRIDRVIEAVKSAGNSIAAAADRSPHIEKVIAAAGPEAYISKASADTAAAKINVIPDPVSPVKAYSVSVSGTGSGSGAASAPGILGTIISYTFSFIFIGALGLGPASELFYPEPAKPVYALSYTDISRLTPPAPAPAPAPTIVPAPAPAPAVTPTIVPAPAVLERPAAFRAAAGISSIELESVYEAADFNRDGALDWNELEKFQKALYRRYDYIYNDTALKPDEFLAAGGGDCEDWALFTCGLLEYWGITSFVGSFGPDQGTGHAVAMVYMSQKPPAKYTAYKIENYNGFPEGWYVPVDYDQVGSLTNAVKKGWHLRDLFYPSSIYGRYM